MATNKTPRKQHYVPKFYLKEFATDETYGIKNKAQVHIYDFKNKEKSIRNIKTIAYEQYLYSPINEENNRSSYMEDKIADIENLMSQIWKDFANTSMGLSPSLKKGISLFIAILILRHPDNLDKNKDMRNFTYTEIMKHIPKSETKFILSINDQDYIVDIKDIENGLNMSQYDESKFFIKNIESLATTIAKIFIKKKWSIIASKERVFITSDRPVIISNPETGLLGVDSKGVIIILPISPTKLLVLTDNTNNEESLIEYPLDKGLASLYNIRICSNAYRYIIGHNKDVEEVVNETYSYNKGENK